MRGVSLAAPRPGSGHLDSPIPDLGVTSGRGKGGPGRPAILIGPAVAAAALLTGSMSTDAGGVERLPGVAVPSVREALHGAVQAGIGVTMVLSALLESPQGLTGSGGSARQ